MSCPGRELAIIGAGGHGGVAYDCAQISNRYDNIFFLDSNYPQKKMHKGAPVVNSFEKFIEAPLGEIEYFVAIGNNIARQSIIEKLSELKLQLATLVHPNATLSEDVRLGEGTLIMPGAVINTGTTLGKGVIVNTCASVDHDSTINNYVHIAPGARLAGGVTVGTCTMIGIGAIVIQNICLASDVIVGAGATVIRDVEASSKVVGTPAVKLNN